MDYLREILAQRSAPGVLILDLEDRLLYSNREALEMLEVLQGGGAPPPLPRQVFEVCGELRSGSGGTAYGIVPHPRLASDGTLMHYAIRALMLGSHGGGDASHVMVLMEKVIGNRSLDIEKA